MKTKYILLAAFFVLLTSVVSCKKDHEIPTGKVFNEESGGGNSGGDITVSTSKVIDITQTTATGGGNVRSVGGMSISERGICWSTSHNPTTSSVHASNGSGTGLYFINMTNLSPNTTYYVRAYAISNARTVYGNEVVFTTSQTDTYTIKVSSNPNDGGDVTGGGSYNQGQSCTVIATAANGYRFTNWTESGHEVSTNANYTFTVNDDRTLVANFTNVPTYTIKVLANPSDGGDVTGGGSYTEGQSCTVNAIANTNYTFTNWTENGNLVSTITNFTFTVTSDRILVANFEARPLAPQGAINGLFTINAQGDKVFFSKGNLQYIGSESIPYWKFADNQWNCLGSTTGQNSTDPNVDRDLFGWGTSGWNSGAVCIQPWSTSKNASDYCPGGSYTNNLTDDYVNADWGVYNAIYNGGNTAGLWRTLTASEWVYVFNRRSGASSKYGHGKVDGVCGMILLPDNWALPSGLSFTAGECYYSTNSYTTDQWVQMETNGAIFLPAAGYRVGTSVTTGGSGYYWSASHSSGYDASRVYFFNGHLDASNNYHHRYYGQSVRLVCPAN